MKSRHFIVSFVCLLLSCAPPESIDVRTINFPRRTDYINSLPAKEKFWIFILAGQSNMAGRGWVEPSDTIPSPRVLTLNAENKWVLAKEPLHYYEPNLTGLDCGLAFGQTLAELVGDSIFIGLVPCAVGGSSSRQWLYDSLHRNVKLYSNLESKVKMAQQVGVVKGIIWHQGEADANENDLHDFDKRIIELFSKFRLTIQNDSLPICTGELGSFVSVKYKSSYPDSINQVLGKLAGSSRSTSLVTTGDLTHQGDTIHFDSPSQRKLGERYAKSILQVMGIVK